MRSLKRKLRELHIKHGVFNQVLCSEEESVSLRLLKKSGEPLPDDIYLKYAHILDDKGRFYRLTKADITEKEINELLMYQQTSYLKSIKNGVMFFVVLTIITIAIAIIIRLFILFGISMFFNALSENADSFQKNW
jgi:hypothetical protein